MKSTLFEDFDKRSQEVRSYFLLLKNLEFGSMQLNIVEAKKKNPKKIDPKKIDNWTKTLKATGFLLLYNLIESTMSNAIETIFDELKEKNVSFDVLKDEIKKNIIKNLKNKSPDKILQEVQKVSIDIVSASFDKNKLFSGNIDAKKIKETATIYGFSCQTNTKKTSDGKDLLIIKTNRNDLSHCFKSFEDVGRDATADELLKIQKRVISYLKAILENIESYLSNEEYLK